MARSRDGSLRRERKLADACIGKTSRRPCEDIVTELDDLGAGAAVVLNTEVNLQRRKCGHDLFQAVRAYIAPKIVNLLVEIGEADKLRETSERFHAGPLFRARVLCLVHDDQGIAVGDQLPMCCTPLNERESLRCEKVEDDAALFEEEAFSFGIPDRVVIFGTVS